MKRPAHIREHGEHGADAADAADAAGTPVPGGARAARHLPNIRCLPDYPPSLLITSLYLWMPGKVFMHFPVVLHLAQFVHNKVTNCNYVPIGACLKLGRAWDRIGARVAG